MKCEVDMPKLNELKISVEAYVVLWCMHNGLDDMLKQYTKENTKISTESLTKLVEQGYLLAEVSSEGKYILSKMSLTDKATSLFPTKQEVNTWIQTWFDLWPKGVKSGGHYVRTDLNDCTKKMIKFCKENPQYTKGIILGATKKYLDDKKEQNYGFCKIAPYFIIKDGTSMLAGACEEIYTSVKGDVDVREKQCNDIDL